jgi:hypothetical protein
MAGYADVNDARLNSVGKNRIVRQESRSGASSQAVLGTFWDILVGRRELGPREAGHASAYELRMGKIDRQDGDISTGFDK